MDVTLLNFNNILPSCIENISNCDYISIDLEFTGITVPKTSPTERGTDINKDDTPNTRYNRILKPVTEEYAIVQVGVTTFHYQQKEEGEEEEEEEDVKVRGHDERRKGGEKDGWGEGWLERSDSNIPSINTTNNPPTRRFVPCPSPLRQLLATPYNFYVFQTLSTGMHSRHPNVTLSVTSVNFLTSNSMDWNKWISSGVPYCNTVDMARLRSGFDKSYPPTMPNGHKDDGREPSIHLDRADDKVYLTRTIASVREWMDSSSARTLDLEPCNAFLRRAVYENLQWLYPDLVTASYEDGQGRKGVRVERLTKEEKIKRYDEERSDARTKLDLELGFGLVYESLVKKCSSTSTPLIVHNGIYDLLFIASAFGSQGKGGNGGLGTYEDAMKYIHDSFPVVYDTKSMGNRVSSSQVTGSDGLPLPMYDNSNLGVSYGWCRRHRSNAVGLACREGFDKYTRGEQLHEAAWDATMTGYVYEVARGVLGVEGTGETANTLNMMRSGYDMILGGGGGGKPGSRLKERGWGNMVRVEGEGMKKVGDRDIKESGIVHRRVWLKFGTVGFLGVGGKRGESSIPRAAYHTFTQLTTFCSSLRSSLASLIVDLEAFKRNQLSNLFKERGGVDKCVDRIERWKDYEERVGRDGVGKGDGGKEEEGIWGRVKGWFGIGEGAERGRKRRRGE